MKSIALIGFMGTGKSTLGKVLAQRLALPLVDLDAVIVQEQQMEIADIFARDGEEGFRQMEHAVLCRYAAQPDRILSPGGGAVLRAENRAVLRGDQPDGAAGSDSGAGESGQHSAAGIGKSGTGAEQATAH